MTFPFGIFCQIEWQAIMDKNCNWILLESTSILLETKSKIAFFYLDANCMNHVNKKIQSRLKWFLFHVQCMHIISNKSKHTLYFAFKDFAKNIKSRITPLCLEFSADKIHFIYNSTMTSNAKWRFFTSYINMYAYNLFNNVSLYAFNIL